MVMENGISVEVYEPGLAAEWDGLVVAAKNGGFWYQRGYLDYHEGRFEDASMVFRREGGEVVAVLPAHVDGDALCSHDGLPFAGLVMSRCCRLGEVEAIFQRIGEKMRGLGLRRLVLKPGPYPYVGFPSDEPQYVMQKLGGRCVDVRMTSMVRLDGAGEALLLSVGRRKKVRRARRLYPYRFEEEADLASVWPELEAFQWRRFGRKPVHRAEEIVRLKAAFPDNIRMLVARDGDRLVGGQLFYLFDEVVRAQYYFRVEDNGQDFLSVRLDMEGSCFEGWRRGWLDLGTSMDPESGGLNAGLYCNKEYAGARAVCFGIWEWEL